MALTTSVAGDPFAPRAGHARLRLRDATAADHAAVDAAYSRFDLTARAGYRAFLQAQYACVHPLEQALTQADAAMVLPDWSSRRRAALLLADLTELGAEPQGAVSRALPPLRNRAAVLGAAYVLEGSRFGGAMIARDLPAGSPARFLKAPAEPASWRALVAVLDRDLNTEPDMAAATDASRAVFAAFESAARSQTECALG